MVILLIILVVAFVWIFVYFEDKKKKQIEEIRNYEEQKIKDFINNIVHDTSQTYPWLSSLYAEACACTDRRLSRFLRTKSHPAYKRAESVDELIEQKKNLQIDCDRFAHQLLVYETCFPWLKDFSAIPPYEIPERFKKYQYFVVPDKGIDISDMLRRKEVEIEKTFLDKEKDFVAFKNAAYSQLCADLDKIIHDNEQTYPWLSELFSEYATISDRAYAKFLRTKPRPALKKADAAESFASQKKELIRQNKFLEHQLLVYESIFPWLEDFKLIPPDQLDQFSDDNSNPSDEYQILKNWLSPEEYKTLSSTEKYQLALDRYQQRNKTDWEVGRDYERFIGYYFESDGWQVRYIGATDGKNDRGIDLIATKGNAHYVIQCKRWSPAHRIIRENAICQLAGSAALYDIELTHKGRFDHITTGVFVTTTTLSDIARDVADKLNVSLIEEKQMESYPCIKCHIAADGEKIYHLPFDQQYDRIIMDPLHGDLYVETTEQAESLGFRKAFRWHSKQD